MVWRGGCLDKKCRDHSKGGCVDRNTEWGDRIRCRLRKTLDQPAKQNQGEVGMTFQEQEQNMQRPWGLSILTGTENL